MVKLRQDFGFALEPREPIRVSGDRCRQNLDGHLAFQLGVGRAVDLTHPTNAERCGHLIGTDASGRSERQQAKPLELYEVTARAERLLPSTP